MLLSEPPESSYDLRFRFWGFPVRITWTFWIAALVFGYNYAELVDILFRDQSPSILPWLLLWSLLMFASILLHELGHAIAFRMCGIESSVVLYHFGGLAIPSMGFNPGRRGGRLTSNEQIFVSAAGPLVQLLLAVVVLLALRAAGYGLFSVFAERKMSFPVGPSFLHWVPLFAVGEPIQRPALFALIEYTLFINIWWPLLNLMPVWPLDGGQIAREIVYKFGGSLYNASLLSLVVAVVIGLWFFNQGQPFAAILFASLAVTNYQIGIAGDRWR